MLAIHNILVPTDFSRPSKYAFRLAKSLARDHSARLILLHVERDREEPSWSHYSLHGYESGEDQTRAARNKLRSLCESASGIVAESRTSLGLPANEILRVAEESHSDLIVMGSHGRKGLDRVLVGSVAEEVMRRANCPVLIVRAPIALHALDADENEAPDHVTEAPGSSRHERMGFDTQARSNVLVSHEAWDCLTCPVTRVHHRAFPDIVGEGGNVEEGIEHLISQLTRAREHFRGSWHIDAIDNALGDIAQYRKSSGLLRVQPV